MHPGFRQKLTSNTKYPFYSRKVNKIYWRYKHLVTGKSHSLGTNEEEATTAYCSGKNWKQNSYSTFTSLECH
ncbi:MAG TPA: hypothetical protein DFK21_05925 [Salmonella bongori]|uniref:Integrase lambda-type N-terminal DNA-binding domain-containing protein n=2 Tax=Salmonella TaxID=590 RepID=A0A750KJK3_SALER|nr:hypothetical protein [Salmonella bongori]EGS1130850.1 hypothetical protein [Salmonella bongori CFSAN000509]QGF78570.1 hypothetical protein GH767_16625 [Salmonella bongori CFSAN000510]TNB50150.1 hypothetical protein FGW25_20650 [Salmonella bongori serovar 48:z35:-]HAC6695356.1 hypothetical protein [Salmonella bongori serovar 44:r:-]